MIPFIDLKKQYSRIEKDVDQAIKKVLMHGQYILGPEVAELEKKLAEAEDKLNTVSDAPAEPMHCLWR